MNAKRILLYTIFFVLALASMSFGQGKQPQPAPRNGYWVVEMVPSPTKKTTVYFYDQTHTLVYRESLKQTRVNLRRKSVVNHFNAVLDQALRQYASTQQSPSDQNWVATRFRP